MDVIDKEEKTYNILIELHQTRLAIVINDENTLDHGSYVAAVVCENQMAKCFGLWSERVAPFNNPSREALFLRVIVLVISDSLLWLRKRFFVNIFWRVQ